MRRGVATFLRLKATQMNFAVSQINVLVSTSLWSMLSAAKSNFSYVENDGRVGSWMLMCTEGEVEYGRGMRPALCDRWTLSKAELKSPAQHDRLRHSGDVNNILRDLRWTMYFTLGIEVRWGINSAMILLGALVQCHWGWELDKHSQILNVPTER